jgi:predicted solute-binding protein
MDRSLLRRLRVGCVRYLNSKPLIYGLAPGEIRLEHPSQLAAQLAAGEIDVGLVPIFEALREPALYRIVDGVAVGCNGPVYSVIMVPKRPLESLRSVWFDPASLTSAHLARVLLEEAFGNRPEAASHPDDADALVLIGDQAIDFRESNDAAVVDLGTLWKERTGLPFVFAVWVARRDCAVGLDDLANFFGAVRDDGLAHLEEIIAAEPPERREFARTYLTEYLRYTLAEAEWAGVRRYAEWLSRYRYIASGTVAG